MRISRRTFIGMAAGAPFLGAQEAGKPPVFRVKVDMVVLAFTVTDSKNHYVNGLKPADIRISEDGIAQKISTFAEGAGQPLAIAENGSVLPLIGAPGVLPGLENPDAFIGTNVFVLFDTSNFMYRSFVYAEDAIADFVRGLDRSDSVAVYTFSRNLVIVFSNGPDNASVVSPTDVSAVAEDEGIPIYVISTNEVNQDPISSASFRRIATRTGGKAYWARSWQKQVEAFEDIREDLGNSYTVTYYPKPNPNDGFRKIAVEISGDPGKKLRVHTRPGYRPTKGA